MLFFWKINSYTGIFFLSLLISNQNFKLVEKRNEETVVEKVGRFKIGWWPMMNWLKINKYFYISFFCTSRLLQNSEVSRFKPVFLSDSKIAQIFYNDPQSAGINVQSPKSESTPWRLTLNNLLLNAIHDFYSPLYL